MSNSRAAKDIHRVSVGEFDVAVVESGTGEPLVLCHGAEADHRHYDVLRPLLAKKVRAIAYDQRDTGGTKGPENDYEMVDLGRDCIALIQALGLDSAHLLGTSLGGMVAMQAAIAAPHRIRSLTLVSTTPSPLMVSPAIRRLPELDPSARQAFMMDALISPERRLADPSLLAVLQASSVNRPPAPAARRLAAAHSHDCIPQLSSISAPTLVIHGEQDPMFPVGAARRLVAEIPNASLMLIPDGRHGLVFEHTELIAQHVLEFMAAYPRQRRLMA